MGNKIDGASDVEFLREQWGMDWATYTRHAVEFHLRNPSAWASERVGEDLSAQVDPECVLGFPILQQAWPAVGAD